MSARVEVNFERELKALRVLVEQTRDGMLAFSLYSDRFTPEEVAEWLRNHCSVPVRVISISTESPDPVKLIRTFSPTPRLCLLFLDAESAFPQLLGYVNYRRELLLPLGHALVFWVREEGMRRIAEEAPDFWAWRSRVFDFRTGHEISLGATAPHDAVIGHYGVTDIEEQITALKESATADLVSQLALGRRQLALRNFVEADAALSLAVDNAARLNDWRGLAEAFLLLGSSKMDQSLLTEAEHLYTQTLEIANRVGLKEQILTALRQLSLLQQRKGNIDLAYDLALRMMKAAQTMEDITPLAGAYDQLGNVLFIKNELREAERAYLTAIHYEELLNHRSDLASTLARLGRVYEAMGAAGEAEKALRRSAALFKDYGSELGEAQVANMLQHIGLQYP